jgi:hypothetical protein
MSPYLVAVVITQDYAAVERNSTDGGPITKVRTVPLHFTLWVGCSIQIPNAAKRDSPVYSIDSLHSDQVWGTTADIEAGREDYAAYVGPKIIQFFEQYYGIKYVCTGLIYNDLSHSRYSLPKMDMVYQHDQPGAAMEVGHYQ